MIIDSKKKLDEALFLYRKHKLKECSSLLHELADDEDVGVFAKSYLGLVYIQDAKPKKAEQLFREVLSSSKPTAEAYYGLGTLFHDDNPGYALAQYEAALRLNPRHAGAKNRISSLDSDKKANEDYSKRAHWSEVEVDEGKSKKAHWSEVSEATSSSEPHQKHTKDKLAFDDNQQHRNISDKKRNKSGYVSDLNTSVESRGKPPLVTPFRVLKFKLVRVGSLAPIVVQMEGEHLQGSIKDNDFIELKDVPKEGRVFMANVVTNITSNTLVTMKKHKKRVLPATAVGWGMLLAFIVLIIGFFNMMATKV